MCINTNADNKHADQIRRILSSQGFTGKLAGKISFTKLGDIVVGSIRYQVFYYTWEESNPPGAAIHASYRIILLQDPDKYIGSYSVEGSPKRLGLSSIQIDYPESLGNTIIFDKSGPPSQVLLNGELHVLAK